jgi:CheY-like chemotaxis protein
VIHGSLDIIGGLSTAGLSFLRVSAPRGAALRLTRERACLPFSLLMTFDRYAAPYALYLESYSGLVVCGEAVDGVDAIEKVTRLKPDLILLDLAMPGMNGVETASVLKGLLPQVRMIAFTMYAESLGKFLASAVGIDAVFAKSEGIAKVVECVRSLLQPALTSVYPALAKAHGPDPRPLARDLRLTPKLLVSKKKTLPPKYVKSRISLGSRAVENIKSKKRTVTSV